ncbi:MAG: hypothetical protein IIA88_00090 [Bacteroidetes bacterium]|nr:hypothetical protein [Bacteroidota bacterium]
MKHQERRREAGKMFIDIAKYIVTVGVIGGIVFEKITVIMAIAIFIAAIISFITGIRIIPPNNKKK